MNRSVKHCAPPVWIAPWRYRALAFLGAAFAGLFAPAGCVIGPGGSHPSRGAIENMLTGTDRICNCAACEASCGAPYDDCDLSNCDSEDPAACLTQASRKKPWHHLPKFRLYEPEAGIFNFCMPPSYIHPPPPLPPGRFFPVPVRPAFAP